MRIVAVSEHQQTLDTVRQVLVVEKSPFEVFCLIGNCRQATAAIEQYHPNLLIIETGNDDAGQLADLENLTLHNPGLAVLLLTPAYAPELLAQAMRVGVREVVPLPLNGDALLDAVFRVQKRASLAHAPASKGKVLAFIACKGGSGATFLAVNLGYAIASLSSKRVALLDLNLHFGNASLFVSDHVPSNTIADIASNIQRLDASFLMSSMVHVLNNFDLLAAPENPEGASLVRSEHIDQLIDLATRNYDIVILDMGRALDAVSVRALDRADLIYPVLQQTLPFIRDAKRMLATFQSLGYGQGKINLVVNRHEKGGDILLEDVESTLNMPVTHIVPNSFKAVSTSVNQGVPVMKLAPSDAVTKALSSWATGMVETNHTKQGGWMARMFNKG